MKKIHALRYFILAQCLLLAAVARAGDGNPFGMKRITWDLEPPGITHVKQANLVLEYPKMEDGSFNFDLDYAQPASMVVMLDLKKLEVPAALLKIFGPLNFSRVILEWFAGTYRLTFDGEIKSGHAESERAYGRILLVWKDGAFAGCELNGREIVVSAPAPSATPAKK